MPVFETTADMASIDAALAALFAEPLPPTALLAESDRIAARALAWLKTRGIAVPAAVSVIGFDGVAEGALTEPPLTTIAQPSAEIGRRAVAVLTAGGDAVTRETLPVTLVERASTAPPPNG